jgi:hypothetical protein
VALSGFPELVEAVRQYDDFNSGNDPYGEHDFGRIVWRDETTYWKIDYYDAELRGGEHPLSPACRRILTMLLAEEY